MIYFLIVFNAVDSLDNVLSSKQPKYLTLDYSIISIPLYIKLSFQLFLIYPSNLKVCILLCVHQYEYLIYCLQTIHINLQISYLIDVQLYEHIYAGMLDRNRPHIKQIWMNSKNRNGPKIDPWGTPQLILDKSEKWLFMLTLNARSDKDDLNHVTLFSVKPMACNLPRRISWSIVSKVFWRSISMIPVKNPFSKTLYYFFSKKRVSEVVGMVFPKSWLIIVQNIILD